MRKLLLITSILVAATSAQAMQTRGLLAPGSNTQTAQLQVDEPKQSVSDQLKAIGETPKPAASEQASAPATAAPAASAQPVATPAATSTQSANARAEAEPASKPAKKAKAQRRETDEQKARRIAARYGISW